MVHLFCYGSLMFTPVWSRVVQGTYDRIEAQLRGFQRRGVRDKIYPCLIPGSHEDIVDGVVYLHIHPTDMARLDAFEGDLYDRQTVTCVEAAQRSYEAAVYVLKARFRSIATDAAWDARWFATEGLPQFLRHYQGFPCSATDPPEAFT
jgi:gamma-glutamylcyclotransferase (GGCT)/AIG2-like uncharacterized protein YtfP